MTTKPQTLGPPLPHEQKGWGRLVRILRDFSSAPVELKLGSGAVIRGVWQLIFNGESHAFHWTGIPVRVWAIILTLLGVMQIWSTLQLKERCRTLASTLMTGIVVYVTAKYVIHDPASIAIPLYFPLAYGEAWIAIRGWPIFTRVPRNGQNPNDI